jgi:Haem-binding domain
MNKGTALIVLIFIALTATMLTAHSDKHDDRTDSSMDQPRMSLSSSEEVTAQRELFTQINASFQTIKPILVRSCYDCHSDKTQFPWYYKIPVPKQLIESDIKEARENIDFSNDFPFGGKHKLAEILIDMREELEDGGMPPIIYRFMRWGHMIEGATKDSVFMWLDSTLLLLGESAEGNSAKEHGNDH